MREIASISTTMSYIDFATVTNQDAETCPQNVHSINPKHTVDVNFEYNIFDIKQNISKWH